MIRWTQADVDAIKAGKKPGRSISEAEFQRQVMRLAVQCGWLCYHTHNSIGSAAGFPDLCAVRVTMCIMAELKAEKGKVTVEQRRWIDALNTTRGVDAYIWRPSDWDTIVETLT